MRGKIDPLVLPEYLTAPYPAYISLQTALFYHGMISQIPQRTYAVTLARTQERKTPAGTLSLFPARSRIFRSLPELELPRSFSLRKARAMIRSLPEGRRRTLLLKRFESTIEAVRKS